MFSIVYCLAYIVLYPFYRYKFIGKENIPSGGCVICGNHTAIIDSVLVVLALGPKGNYAVMAKAELFKSKLFGLVLRFVRAFPVKRGENDMVAVKSALKTLKDGKKLILFPEGTRVKEGESAELKSGAGMFALRGKVPVVPVFIPEGRKAFRRNVIIFGKPMDGHLLEAKKTTSDDYSAFTQEIMNNIAQLNPGKMEKAQ